MLLRPSPGGVDTLLECRRKTELVGTILDLNPQVSTSFADIFNVTIQGGKSKEVKFIKVKKIKIFLYNKKMFKKKCKKK